MNYLVLVNKNNLIKDNYYDNIQFVDTKDVLNEDVKVEKTTYEAYLKLKEYLESINIYIGIDSAYRSIEEQQEIWDEFTIKYGSEYTHTFVALPKTSEHHTGLVIDLSIKVDGKYLVDNKDLFANEEIYKKIHPHLYKFGFILRYPKGKENITGYGYEPWHIRYVGVKAASKIYNNNLVLEEYLMR